jgi:hypothetical protein
VSLDRTSRRLRLVPYPDGKAFAFTIVDDTDGLTLETARPIYDYLFELGLKTTKTVWVRPPEQTPERFCDQGDTLARPEYTDYHRLLRDRGFEIALHNVSSRSNTRAQIVEGFEEFRRTFGMYPRMNVHHEKNRENLYFDAAQDPDRLPPAFASRPMQKVHALLRGGQNGHKPVHECAGEKPSSAHYWGDVCKRHVKYVRTNVFLDDLNTLKVDPRMPRPFADTPLVNFWFHCSNGQDASHFNAILSDANIARLREERGCCLLYTHFGKGFVIARPDGTFELNEVTKQRLAAAAAHADAWFAPASDILDRLLLFQKVTLHRRPTGVALRNDNECDVHAVTLQSAPGSEFNTADGRTITLDHRGHVIVPILKSGEEITFVGVDPDGVTTRWFDSEVPAFIRDVQKIWQRVAYR